MLIAFSVKNFKSIRELQTLSMEASADDHLEWSNVIEDGKRRVVKTTVVYGSNASGKSNLIQAMRWFASFVRISSRETQIGESIDVEPFLLCSETEHAPTHFEVEFRWKGMDYRYGFEVTSNEVQSEWLFRRSPESGRESKLFSRNERKFEVPATHFKEGRGLEEKTRPNALFLSVCAQFNGAESGKILEWFRQFRFVSGLGEGGFFHFTASRLQNSGHQEQLLEFVQKADFNIKSLRSVVEEKELDGPLNESEVRKSPSKRFLPMKIKTTHNKRDGKGEVIGEVEFDLEQNESSGTKKFVALSGPILHTIEEGSLLIVDELEARLHPRLTQAIIDLFQSAVNRKNAQLICATHDVTLLEPDRFRRDQIWFCEKDETGATDLFSLGDFSSNLVRPTSKFSRQYMLGLFGALPQLSQFQQGALNAKK